MLIVARRRQGEADDGQTEGRGDVLGHDVAGLAGQLQQERDVAQVVVHQRDACGVGRDVRAGEPHGDADVGRGEDRAVVDAVADDQRAVPLATGGT